MRGQWLAYCAALLSAGGVHATGNQTEVVTEAFKLTVQGQSGKFTLLSTQDAGKSIKVEFISLHEVGPDGAKTRNSNNVNSFATTSFTIGDLQDGSYNGVDCKTIGFSS
jgi:hypothetical protein